MAKVNAYNTDVAEQIVSYCNACARKEVANGEELDLIHGYYTDQDRWEGTAWCDGCGVQDVDADYDR